MTLGCPRYTTLGAPKYLRAPQVKYQNLSFLELQAEHLRLLADTPDTPPRVPQSTRGYPAPLFFSIDTSG